MTGRLYYLALSATAQSGAIAALESPLMAFGRSLTAAGVPAIYHRKWHSVRLLARVVGKLRLHHNLVRIKGRAYVAAWMWPNDGYLFPFAFFSEIIPYVMDCWPPDYPRWESLFRRNRIRTAFFSSKGSAQYFDARLPGFAAYWLPEACDPNDYQRGKPLSHRTIDLLELGRRFDAFHLKIREQLLAAGCTHLYARSPGALVFADQASLLQGLGDTKISVCFPKSMTYPGERSRGKGTSGLETVTLRYFESMASKCVVLGHCPAELKELFGYDPVIAFDPIDPARQVLNILGAIDDYQDLVDRNYARLLEVGTWTARVKSMLSSLERRGWVPPSAGHER